MDNTLTHIEELSPAEKLYQHHKRHVQIYQRNNPEKMRSKSLKYLQKLKETEPERFKQTEDKQNVYYETVVKPKREEILENLNVLA